MLHLVQHFEIARNTSEVRKVVLSQPFLLIHLV